MPEPPMRSTPPDPAPATIWRSDESVASGDAPPVVHVADTLRVGDARVVEEHLVEVDVAGDVAQRPDLDARLVQVDEEVGDALALGDVGVGAREQHGPVGEVGPRGPDLLAGHDPVVAVADRAGRQRREVGSRPRAR